MNKSKKILTSLAAAFTLGSTLLTTTVSAAGATSTNNSSTTQVSSNIKNEWVYPFAKNEKYGVRPMYRAQTFGKTDFARSIKPLSYFHNGWDFGWGEVGRSTVNAIHPGTVQKVAYGNGLGWFVWVVSPDNFVEIYQEGFKKKKDIYVKPGQQVKAGQKIGKLTGTHLHLGVTTTDSNYINKNGFPCENWWKDNGTWLNPITVIKNGKQSK